MPNITSTNGWINLTYSSDNTLLQIGHQTQPQIALPTLKQLDNAPSIGIQT
ncbi:MAG: hypothetical protein J6W64_05750 [Bacilli bacterium]|nr:hypothetical protein [Bacilli bacterium]